jgi:tRNA pseudouridine55 synthase
LVECSKGTYIRSLIKDIAERLETVATMNQLRRISCGDFHIQQAIKQEVFQAKKNIVLVSEQQ